MKVVEVAAEEEAEYPLSLEGNIAVSLATACVAAVGMVTVLGPGLAACVGALAGAASFGWGVFLGGADDDDESPEPADDDDYYF
jgi:hypothetical protein